MKARRKCCRCGKAKYAEAAQIDRSEPFLCDRCDDAFIVWHNSGNKGTLEDFLRCTSSDR